MGLNLWASGLLCSRPPMKIDPLSHSLAPPVNRCWLIPTLSSFSTLSPAAASEPGSWESLKSMKNKCLNLEQMISASSYCVPTSPCPQELAQMSGNCWAGPLLGTPNPPPVLAALWLWTENSLFLVLPAQRSPWGPRVLAGRNQIAPLTRS